MTAPETFTRPRAGSQNAQRNPTNPAGFCAGRLRARAREGPALPANVARAPAGSAPLARAQKAQRRMTASTSPEGFSAQACSSSSSSSSSWASGRPLGGASWRVSWEPLGRLLRRLRRVAGASWVLRGATLGRGPEMSVRVPRPGPYPYIERRKRSTRTRTKRTRASTRRTSEDDDDDDDDGGQ